MSKELALQIIRLLSSFETASLVSKISLPDYLWEQQAEVMDQLTAIVLEKQQ